MLSDMIKANQAFATAASALMDGARGMLDVHADNGAVRPLHVRWRGWCVNTLG